MTYEKAIDAIIDMRMQEIFPSNGDEVLSKAQEAIEKQIPEKPVAIFPDPLSSLFYKVRFKCPCCAKYLYVRVDFCQHCGQAIDWTEE